MTEDEFLEKLKAIRDAIDFQWRVAKVLNNTLISVNVDHADTIYSVLTYVIDTAEKKHEEGETRCDGKTTTNE